MATDIGHVHYGWAHEDPTPRDDPQIVDHGSISFGRYAVESLSWEKRSVFTVNRRQEELDKFSEHGLVAKKKAYFEEFYKRIRTAKSSPSSQQNQITLGSDISSSCQTTEDETDFDVHPGYGAVRNYDSHLENVAIGIAFKKVTDNGKAVLSNSRENIPVAHPELLSSPREISEDVNQDTIVIDAIQIEHSDKNLIANDTILQSREIIDHGGKYSHDKEEVSAKISSSSSDIELVISAESSASFTPHVRLQKSKAILSENTVKREAHQNTNKYKQENASVPKVKKDHALLSRGATKVDCRNKSSHGSNPVHKQVGEADNGIQPIKRTADKHSSNDMSSSVSSSRPLTERRSNVTIPRPFSFATEKRTTAPSRLKGNTQQPASNFLASAAGSTKLGTNTKGPVSCPSRRLTSSLPNAKFTDVQEFLNKTTTATSAKGEKLEDKRFSSSKGRGASLVGSTERRSFDLPRPKESRRLGGNNKLKYSDMKTKEKEAEAHGRLMPEVHHVSSDKAASNVSGNLRKPNEKALLSRSMNLSVNSKKHRSINLSSRSMNLSVDSRKPRSINLSLDGNKPRQVKPHWR